MADETHEESHDEEATGIWARETAPQSPYTGRQIGIGIVIFLVGLVVTFGLPLVLV